MQNIHHHKEADLSGNVFVFLKATKADSLTGFIAGFLAGVIGMYVYALIMRSIG